MSRDRKPEPERQYDRREYITEAGNRIIIERPVLTERERAERMAEISAAAAALIMDTERRRTRAWAK